MKESCNHMLRIRLRRVGAKKQPSYRIVIADSRSPRDGRFLEKIGFYNPRTQPATIDVNEERALYWLSNGAKPSDAVQRILDRVGTTERYGRWRAGEDVEALIAEAMEASEARLQGVDQRTRRDGDSAKPKMSKRAQAKAAAAAAVEEVVEEAPVEEAAEMEAEAEAEVATEEEIAVEEPEAAMEETAEMPVEAEDEPAAEASEEKAD
jgi:small subunit ribosomal protein S16